MVTPTKKSRGGGLAVATPAKATGAKSGLSPATKQWMDVMNVAARMAVVLHKKWERDEPSALGEALPSGMLVQR